MLVGSARDERGRRLRGAALSWHADGRRLGSGERLTAILGAGKVKLQLRARDARGRDGIATRSLFVAPVTLQIKTLRAPERLGVGARSIKVRIATSVPAMLRAGGRRFRLDTSTRTVRIPLPGRSRPGVVRLRLAIAAKGPRQPTLRETIVVALR